MIKRKKRKKKAKILFFFVSLTSSLSPFPPPSFLSLNSHNDQSRLSRLGAGASNARPEMRDGGRRTRAAHCRVSPRLPFSIDREVFKPRSATPSSFPLPLFPKLTSFPPPSPPFPTIPQCFRPSHRRRRRRGPPRPLLPAPHRRRFPRRRRRRLAARRSRRRSRSPSPSGPLPCCLPGPRPRKVRSHRVGHTRRLD